MVFPSRRRRCFGNMLILDISPIALEIRPREMEGIGTVPSSAQFFNKLI